MPLTRGDRLGPYEVLSPLGSGGMGVVYRAHDKKLGRDVAIKMLSAKGAADPDRLRRFEQEARAASALDHPNIITIHEIGDSDGQPYLVMQLVEGKSLRELIASKRLSVAETLAIATQIADGLSRAHRNGIVHRDLKPDNIMVNADGLVKILDFGLAKLAEPAVGSELATIDREKPQTQEGHIVGTAQYMSPEQAQGETVDARSDIFSLGAILFEMVTGRRAFKGDNAVALLADIVSREPERLTALDPSLPVDLDKIVHRALRKNPERRFQNASDMKVALDELGDELASGDALKASDIRVARRTTKRWWLVASAAAAVGIAVVAWLIWGRPPDLPPMRVVPLTTDVGDETEPALSPDGRQLAFTKSGHIFVKLIGEGDAVQLTRGDVSDAAPAWSPEGTRLAFLRHRDNSGVAHDVLEVPAVGGSPKVIGRADSLGHVLSYSPDGSHLAVTHQDREGPPGVFLLSRETGESRRLTTPPTGFEGEDRYPRFSPDGRYLAFSRVQGGIGVGDVRAYDLVKETEWVLDSERGLLRGLDFAPDGRHVVYAVGQSDDSMHLAVTPLEGGTSRSILPGERAARPSTSRLGNRLAYVRDLRDINIWRIPGPAAKTRTAPEQVIGSTWTDAEPALSPDGRRLAFKSGRSGADAIWIADADGSSPTKLTNLDSGMLPRWSPDGRRVAFVAASLTDPNLDVFVVDARGGFPTNLTPDEFDDVFPCWSPDGRYVYYQSFRDVSGIWRVAADGGKPELVARDASWHRMSADGTLFFERNGMIVRWRGSYAEPVTVREQTAYNWFPWRELIVIEKIGRERAIQLFDTVAGTTTTLLELDRDINALSVSDDGQWIYYDQIDRTGTDIMLVENFQP